jgi:Lrp/AsnC family transcriptional regulator, regulator for asnA, asnC and gidA
VHKINELDSQILKNLFQDGRRGYNEIAEECGISENKVWKRCRAMEKQGIISGATVQMNFGHFGFDALVTLLISVEAQQIENAMEIIRQVTDVRAYRQYNSVYNIRAVATLKDLNELDHFKQLIKRKLPTLGLKSYIWTGVRNIPENLNLTNSSKAYSGNFEGNQSSTISMQNGRYLIDELDKLIVTKLTSDGQMSFTRIAQEMKLSTDTVLKRYYKLKKSGSIKVSIQINPNKIGYKSILDFNVAFTTPGNFSDVVIESLARIPDVIIITKTSGDFDLQVTAMVRDIPQSFTIQDQISRICGITKIETNARKIPDKWPTPQQYISTF